MLDAGTWAPRERLTRREAGAQSHGPLPRRGGRATERRWSQGWGQALERVESPTLTEKGVGLHPIHRRSSPIHRWAPQAVVEFSSNAHGTSAESSASFGFGPNLQGP
jgi:hypothetical protein